MAGTPDRLHYPATSSADGPWSVSLTPERVGWSWTGLRVVELPAGGAVGFTTGATEILVLPLAGACVVESEGRQAELTGRTDVFSGPTDFVYVPVDTVVSITSEGGGRFAVPAAKAHAAHPFRYVAASQVSVEARGAGNCSRLICGYCMPDTLEADRLMVCEVITPGGNWSSYPPHKHDEEREGESVLEEIYYFEVADGAGASSPGAAYQRVYGTRERPIDVLAEVRSGDVVLVPHGWHGPSMALPGYDLYYLNVMAGPGERVWRICDDPAYAWIRDTWPDQPVDPRVLDLLHTRRAS